MPKSLVETAARAKPARPPAGAAESAPALFEAAPPPLSRRLLPHDSAKYPVHEPRRVVARVAAREVNGLVDRDLVGDVVAVQLMEGDPQDVPFDRAEPACRPVF